MLITTLDSRRKTGPQSCFYHLVASKLASTHVHTCTTHAPTYTHTHTCTYRHHLSNEINREQHVQIGLGVRPVEPLPIEKAHEQKQGMANFEKVFDAAVVHTHDEKNHILRARNREVVARYEVMAHRTTDAAVRLQRIWRLRILPRGLRLANRRQRAALRLQCLVHTDAHTFSYSHLCIHDHSPTQTCDLTYTSTGTDSEYVHVFTHVHFAHTRTFRSGATLDVFPSSHSQHKISRNLL